MSSGNGGADHSDKKGDHINLKVRGQGADGEVFFKIKRDTPLAKLFQSYCDKVGKSIGSVRFSFEGDRLSGTDTAAKVGLENDDVIDALAEQTGGGFGL